jgi:hypothetical protein
MTTRRSRARGARTVRAPRAQAITARKSLDRLASMTARDVLMGSLANPNQESQTMKKISKKPVLRSNTIPALAKETVRVLSTSDLQRAAGGNAIKTHELPLPGQ